MPHRDSFRPSDLIVVKRARPSMLLPLGSFVRLASGGPVGVLTAMDDNDKATVTWFTTPPCERVISDVCLVSASNECGARRFGAVPDSN